MYNINTLEYLDSTVNMINKSFPDGLDENRYFGLLYLLYDYMSDENLSKVMEMFVEKDISNILNDIYKVYHMKMNTDLLKELQDKLNKNGFIEWAKEE